MPFQKTIMRTTFGTLKISLITVVVLSLVSCGESYEDPYGNKITKEEHERRVANDAAHDALINLAESRTKCNTVNGTLLI